VTFSIRSHEYRRSPRALAPGRRISGVHLADAKIIGVNYLRVFLAPETNWIVMT
jgi:hypothetical protein